MEQSSSSAYRSCSMSDKISSPSLPVLTRLSTAISRLLDRIHSNTTIPDFSTSTDSAQVARQIRSLCDLFSGGEDPEKCLLFQVLLEKVVVALTERSSSFKLDEQFGPVLQLLTRKLRVELVPLELYGYYLNRLVARLVSNVEEEEVNRDGNGFPFAPGVLMLLPHFFNASMRQQRLEIGIVEVVSSEELRERVMGLLSKEAFWNFKWAAEFLEQLKLLDLSPKEMDMICIRVNQHVLSNSMPIEAIGPVISSYLALALKPGARPSLILSGIVNFFHLLETQRQEDDYHESQTGTQAMRAMSTHQLRETEVLSFVTFDQYFTSHPTLALEFIQMTKHSIAKGGLRLFSLGVLLTICRTSRQASKYSEKAMEALLLWAHSLRASTGNNSSSTSSSTLLGGKPVPPALKLALPNFDGLVERHSRLVDASRISAGPLSIITCDTLLQACADGWDLCVNGLLDLAFQFMRLDLEEASKTCTRTGKSQGMLTKHGYFSKQTNTILCALFEGFETVRSRILDDLFFHLLCQPETALVTVDILSEVVRANRTHMTPYLPKFNEMVYQLGALTPAITKRLIRAFDPIMSSHPELKDLLVMALRKASFSHDMTARSVSVTGFVQLLRAHLASLTSSKTLSPSAVEQMSLECLSFVRRSFTQQPVIRISLYRDLASAFNDALTKKHIVLASSNGALFEPTSLATTEVATQRSKLPPGTSRFHPGTTDTLNVILTSIMELLLAQLSSVIGDDGKHATFDIANCLRSRHSNGHPHPPKQVDNGSSSSGHSNYPISPSREIQEPLHVLLMASNCMVLGEAIRSNGINTVSAVTMPLYAQLNRFVSFVLRTELEHFELDKSSDFSLGTSDGLANQEAATLVLGIYEMCIENLMTVRLASLHHHPSLQRETDSDMPPPSDLSNFVTETDDEAQLRYKNVHSLFKNLLQLRGLVKESKGSLKLHSAPNATSKDLRHQPMASEDAEMDGDELVHGNTAIPTKRGRPGGGLTSGASKPTKLVVSRPSLLSRRCIVDMLTLVCNPIKAMSLRGADNQPIRTPLVEIADDFAVVQYVLSVALAQCQTLSSGRKSRESQRLVADEAIEALVNNMHAPEYLEKTAGFLFYEASSPPRRITPLGALPTSTLALQIYVEGLKYILQESENSARAVAKFVSSSVSFMLSHDSTRSIISSETSDDMKISHFVAMIQSFVTKDKCFSDPRQMELYMAIISLLSPLLSKPQLKSTAHWIEKLIANTELDLNGSDADIDERRLNNDLGLKLVPMMWSMLDQCEGNEIKSSYLMFARDLFMICGGNGGIYAQEDAERLASHSLTFSVNSKSTAADVAASLITHLSSRLHLIEELYTEISKAEKFVVVGADGQQVLPPKGKDYDGSSDSSEEDGGDDETPMDMMMTDEDVSRAARMATQANQATRLENEVDDSESAISWSVHLKRKTAVYMDLTELLEILYCLSSTQLPNAASVNFAKMMEHMLKMIHSWLSGMLKRKDFEPIVPAFETFVSNLGLLFGRLHAWLTSWLQGKLPFLPLDEKKRQKMVSQARTAASKQAPGLVFWMEKIHAEDLIKLAARAAHPSLLNTFKTSPHHDFALQEGAIAQKMLSKKRKAPSPDHDTSNPPVKRRKGQ